MRYAVTNSGFVENIVESEADFAATQGWILAPDASIWDLWDGEAFTSPAPVMDPVAVQASVIAATQARLDAFAKTRNYDGILSASTYATSTVLKFAAEGQYAVDARDQTWSALYALMAEVLAGTRPMPESFAEVEPLLPNLVWPA